MRKMWLAALIPMFIVVLLVSCAPRAVKPPPITPSRTAAAPAVVPTPTREEAAWDKVVAAARKEGRVTLYGAQLAQSDVRPALEAFGRRYGIVVECISGRGAEFLERLKTEKRMGQMTGDSINGSPPHTESMRQEGLLEDASDLPVLKEQGVWYMDPGLLSPDKRYLIYGRIFNGPIINTKLVKPEEAAGLNSWRSFLDPKWKGNLVMADPQLAAAAYYFLANIKLGRLDMEFLRALGKQELRFVPSPTNEVPMVAQGQVSISLTSASMNVAAVISEGAPIRRLDMKEGIWLNGLVIGLVRGSPHPNAAKVFHNWALSEEGQSLISKGLFTSPIRKGVSDPLPEAARLEPKDPILLTNELNELAAKGFRDKELLAILKPK